VEESQDEHDLAAEAERSGCETRSCGVNQPPPVPPRTKRRSREREGAETEVEVDAGGMRPGIQRSQTRVQQTTSEMGPVIDLTEDDDLQDEEMADAALDFGGRTAHIASGSFNAIVGIDAEASRSASLSPDFSGHGGGFGPPRHNGAGTSGGAGAGADTSEGEGSGSGSADEVMEAELHGNGGAELIPILVGNANGDLGSKLSCPSPPVYFVVSSAILLLWVTHLHIFCVFI
jgi:hypothetical protein